MPGFRQLTSDPQPNYKTNPPRTQTCVRRFNSAPTLIATLLSLVANAQTVPDIPHQLVEQRLCLGDLRNEWFTVIFPRAEENTNYSGHSEYLYSVVAPNGRSLFAVRRQFDASGFHQFDTLIRRELRSSDASSEEIIFVPFEALSQFAVSPNERLMVIAGRFREPNAPGKKQDGIFLLDRETGNVQPIASYDSLSVQIRSFNVSDHGAVIYEDDGAIVTFERLEGRTNRVERHPGRLPALMPNGQGYFYANAESLILDDGKSKREILHATHVIGAIRVSPDASFVAFGVGVEQDGETQLRVCDLRTKACVNGPRYVDWIAGRETFWIQR